MFELLSLSKKMQVDLSCGDKQLKVFNTCYMNKYMYAVNKFVGSFSYCKIMYTSKILDTLGRLFTFKKCRQSNYNRILEKSIMIFICFILH